MLEFEVVDFAGREHSSGDQLRRVFLICRMQKGRHDHLIILDLELQIMLHLLREAEANRHDVLRQRDST